MSLVSSEKSTILASGWGLRTVYAGTRAPAPDFCVGGRGFFIKPQIRPILCQWYAMVTEVFGPGLKRFHWWYAMVKVQTFPGLRLRVRVACETPSWRAVARRLAPHAIEDRAASNWAGLSSFTLARRLTPTSLRRFLTV